MHLCCYMVGLTKILILAINQLHNVLDLEKKIILDFGHFHGRQPFQPNLRPSQKGKKQENIVYLSKQKKGRLDFIYVLPYTQWHMLRQKKIQKNDQHTDFQARPQNGPKWLPTMKMAKIQKKIFSSSWPLCSQLIAYLKAFVRPTIQWHIRIV